MTTLTKEDRDFLTDLANKILTQDNFCTRTPVFYQVAETLTRPCRNGCGDFTVIVGEDGASWDDKEEFRKKIVEEYIDSIDGTDEDAEEQMEDSYYMDVEELAEWANGLLNTNEYEGCEMEEYMKLSGSFLTLEACQKHIEQNRHNYTKPHTCCDHFYRNPEAEKLMDIILKFSTIQKESAA